MRPPTPARPSRNGKMSTGWPRPIGPSPITGGEKGTDTVCQSDSACDVLVNKPVRQTIQFSSPADKPRAGDHGSRRHRQGQSRGVWAARTWDVMAKAKYERGTRQVTIGT